MSLRHPTTAEELYKTVDSRRWYHDVQRRSRPLFTCSFALGKRQIAYRSRQLDDKLGLSGLVVRYYPRYFYFFWCYVLVLFYTVKLAENIEMVLLAKHGQYLVFFYIVYLSRKCTTVFCWYYLLSGSGSEISTIVSGRWLCITDRSFDRSIFLGILLSFLLLPTINWLV